MTHVITIAEGLCFKSVCVPEDATKEEIEGFGRHLWHPPRLVYLRGQSLQDW